MRREPRPRAVAKLMVRVCEKLWKDGDRALKTAKENESPVRARSYSQTDSRSNPEGEDSDPGYNDQTGNVACARTGRKTLYQQLCDAVNDLEVSLIRVDGVFGKILGNAQKAEASRKMRQPGSGRCVACGEFMPGTRDHRIRDGFCPKDYEDFHEARRRGVTRGEYIAKVRRRTGYDGRGDDE